jgi:hypothetical protein
MKVELMKFNELPNWPPPWKPLPVRNTNVINGEIGVFKSLRPLSDDYVLITMEFHGLNYSGMLQVQPHLKNKAVAILEKQKGCSMKEIGKIEID